MQTSSDEDEREGGKGSSSCKADAFLPSLIDGGISPQSPTLKLGLNHDVARIVTGDPFQVSTFN